MAKRRGKGEGSIAQRQDGRWQARISLGWKSGKRHVKYLYAATRGDVAKLLRAELKRRDDGKPINLPAAPTLNVFAEQWLTNERDTLRPSTLKFYRDNLDNHVLPALGKIRLSAIRRTHVNSLMRGLTGLGPLARQGVRRTLSACLAAAIDEELIELNPCRATGRRKARGLTAKAEPDPLTREEARLIGRHGARPFRRLVSARNGRTANRTAALRTTGARMARHRMEGRPTSRRTSDRARTRRTAEEWGSSRRRPIA
jgi:hypothetical protein